MMRDMVSPVTSHQTKRHVEALPLEHWFELPEWEPAPPASPPDADELGLTVVVGDGELARELYAQLRALGAEALAAGTRPPAGGLTVDPVAPADYTRLLERIADRGDRPARIVLAWAPDPARHPDPVEAGLHAGLYPAIALAQAVAAGHDRRRLTIDIITAGAHDVDGTERTDPALTTVLGPTRVIPLELPHVAVRQIDVEAGADPRRVSERALAEFAHSPAAALVAHRGAVRWLPSLRPVTLAGDGASPWRRQGVYLITGGFGGLALALAEHLAGTFAARLALVARTPLPPREQWERSFADGDSDTRARIATVRRLEALGGVVSVHTADVADAAQMTAVRDTVLARFGRLDGIVHAAGLAGGGLTEVRRPDEIRQVLAPKIAGTLVLSEVFGALPLDFLVLCSSLTSFVGGIGQVDYCAANAFLDAFPRSGRALADRTLAVNWGGLLGEGMWIPHEDDVGMELEEAVEALGRALGADLGPRISIAPVRVDDARPWLPDAAQGAGPERERPEVERARGAELERRLAQLWAQTLELEEVPGDGNFFALGGDSLLGIELLWKLADELGFRLPMQLLVEAGTPAAVAQAIEARLGAA
jgi:phthiocerol/phenolphthiocerol synthesis type-I polyketide synthase E